MTIGEKLKRERKKLGYDLDNVAKETKIAKMFLIAIENDELSSLPGGVYTRNFLRAYAKYLGLDEDIITAEYHEQYEVKPHFVVHQEQTKRDDMHFKRQRWRFFVAIFLILVVLGAAGAIFYYFPFWESEPTVKSSSAPVQLADQRDVALQTPLSSETAVTTQEKVESGGVGTPSAGDIAPADVGSASAQDNTTEALVEKEAESLSPAPTSTTITEGAIKTETANPGNILPFPTLAAISDYFASENLNPNYFYGEATRLEEMFAIEAVGPVDIEVYVDGEMATRRHLKPGQVRFYRYGRYNRVIIGDISQVNLQDGGQFFAGTPLAAQYVYLPDFEQGGMLSLLQDVLRAEN